MATVSSTTRASVYAALIANLLIAVTKFLAAVFSGSSAMLSEAFHSLVDTGNEALLLYGQHRANREPDAMHPLGYGRELYFWSFVVAVLIFAAGAGLALYEGVSHLLHPEPMKNALTNYIVLAVSLCIELISWCVALRNFRAASSDLQFWTAIRQSKDPAAIIVLLEDSAAIIGVLIAFAGTLAVQYSDNRIFDGVASILIGLLLATVAVILARESKGLLIGEPANSKVSSAIREIASAGDGVQRVENVFTVHLAPDQIAAMLALDFKDRPGQAWEVEESMRAIEHRILDQIPGITAVFFLPPKPRATASFSSRSRTQSSM